MVKFVLKNRITNLIISLYLNIMIKKITFTSIIRDFQN